MQPDIKKYKLVRRGAEKYCLRIRGTLNVDHCTDWCNERSMVDFKIKKHVEPNSNSSYHVYRRRPWDYDLKFNDKRDALGFIIGYL